MFAKRQTQNQFQCRDIHGVLECFYTLVRHVVLGAAKLWAFLMTQDMQCIPKGINALHSNFLFTTVHNVVVVFFYL